MYCYEALFFKLKNQKERRILNLTKFVVDFNDKDLES